MLMIETELRLSPIHGIGVFVLEPVKRGDLVWRVDSRIDRIYCEQELTSLPAHVQRFLRTYSTWHEATKLFVLCGDNGRHFNHSANPSTVSNAVSFGEDRAAHDLIVGDELTSDYSTICDISRREGVDFNRAPLS